MSKRKQDKQLTKDNYDEGSGSEDENPTGGFQFASEEEIKGRQIIKPRSTRKKDKKESSTPTPTATSAAPALSFDFSSSSLDSFTPFAAPGATTNGDSSKSTNSLEKRLASLEAEVTALRQRVAKLEGKPEEASAPTDAASSKFEFSFPSELNDSTPASATGSLSWEQFASTESATSSDFSKLAGTGETPAWSDNSNYVVPDLEEKAPKPTVVLAPAEPVSTGEEDEENVVTCRVKLYTLTPKEAPEGEEGKEQPAEGAEPKSEAQMEWKETGVGNLKLNKLSNGKARLIMRTDTTFRLILNTLIFPEMSVKKPSEKSLLLVAVDEQLKPKSHMIKFQNAQQTSDLFDKIEQFKKEAPKTEKKE